MGGIVFLAVVEIFTTIFERNFCETILWKKKVRPITEWCLWGGYFVVFNLATYLVQGPVWYNLLVFVVTFFLTVRLLYANSNRTLVGVTAFLYLSGMCSELMVYFGVRLLSGELIGNNMGSVAGSGVNLSAGNELLPSVMSRLIWFCIAGMVSLMIRQYRKAELDRNDWLAVFFVPMGSVVILAALYHSAGTEGNGFRLVTVVILLFINIFVYYLYEKTKDGMERRLREELLSRQCAYYLRQNEENRKWWETLAAFRHDMKQRYVVEKTYLEAGDYGELGRYLDECAAFLNRGQEISVSHTGNIYIDSLLNYKAALAAQEGIGLVAELHVAADAKPNAEDLDICLGNLLDNALEAVAELGEQEDNKRIYVRIKADGRNLFLSVRNPFDRPRKQENGKYLTGKMVEGEVHGLGLAMVQRIVDKYEGQMEIHEEGQVFEVSAVLYEFFA